METLLYKIGYHLSYFVGGTVMKYALPLSVKILKRRLSYYSYIPYDPENVIERLSQKIINYKNPNFFIIFNIPNISKIIALEVMNDLLNAYFIGEYK